MKSLSQELHERKVSPDLIDDVIESGYHLRAFRSHFDTKNTIAVSDKMFGNKQHSSIFDVEKFISYIHGNYQFPELPKFRQFTVKTISEIHEILNDSYRQRLIKNGKISFRGQPKQYEYKRKIPNPVRADKNGYEISITPGIYRQNSDYYSFNKSANEYRSFQHLLRYLEPNFQVHPADSQYSYDIMRVEQHYASQTSGLDISFDIETALFFATQKFQRDTNGKAFHRKIKKGEHEGVIYGFCFRDPSVRQTEYLIKDFDFFKTYKPERIIRQNCGLPLFDRSERNIAITDLDFIIHLHEDFEYTPQVTPLYMFPDESSDRFYKKIIELKQRFPNELANIVEYKNKY